MRGQAELLGLAIIVVLAITGLAVYAALSTQESNDVAGSFVQSNVASRTLDSVLDGTFEHEGFTYKIEDVIEQCSKEALCEQRNAEIKQRLDFISSETGRDYSFRTDGIVIESSACGSFTEQAVHHIPKGSDVIEVRLRLC